jgi:hypothetical protein
MTVDVGDVLTVQTRLGIAEKLIDIGEVLMGEPGYANHVIVVSHQTTDGVWHGVQGQPGGVGWVDCRPYLDDPHTTSNSDQPKTAGQRKIIQQVMQAMIGTPYDWTAIAHAAADALHLPDLFAQNWHGKGYPGHVICSSLASYGAMMAGLAHPKIHTERDTTPADWSEFNIAKAWLL